MVVELVGERVRNWSETLSKVIYQSVVVLLMWQMSSLCKTAEMAKFMVDSRHCDIVCKILYALLQVRTTNMSTQQVL